MAARLVAPPGIADLKNFRAREAFDQDLERHGKFVGSTTVDVGSIAAGAIGTVTITVTGARADMGQTVRYMNPAQFSAFLDAQDSQVKALMELAKAGVSKN